MLPAFKGRDAELRVRIYKRLLEHAGEGGQVPPQINPANDWTSKYLKDVLGEKALEHPDIRSHFGRGGTLTVPGSRTRTQLPTATNAPAHMQPYLASGSNTTPLTYDLRNAPASALKAMTFDETDEEDEDEDDK
ncbi:hypothetical protein OC842_007282 [Tilletia horrida]|uniref:Uncharacterized protein n=1 Tax=Tilletia horrida TaxID=155126 RepID=A0AAN6JH45_9BASI|nr:hypothetical protein OC842_007282 [Tilletia horrida]